MNSNLSNISGYTREICHWLTMSWKKNSYTRCRSDSHFEIAFNFTCLLRHLVIIHLTHTHGSIILWRSRVKKISALALRPSVGQNLISVYGLLNACLFYSHMVSWCFPSRVQYPCMVEGLKISFKLKKWQKMDFPVILCLIQKILSGVVLRLTNVYFVILGHSACQL